jgi:hypothetical protein
MILPKNFEKCKWAPRLANLNSVEWIDFWCHIKNTSNLPTAYFSENVQVALNDAIDLGNFNFWYNKNELSLVAQFAKNAK